MTFENTANRERNQSKVRIALSIIIWTTCTIVTVILFFIVLFLTIILFPFDKKRKAGHVACFWWANTICNLNPYWKLRVHGLENIDNRKAYVIVANHQSLGDILLMYKTHIQFKWVAKESLFKVPFIGWNLSLIKHIKLSRGQFGSIKKTYQEAAKWLRSGMSVLFFPEGTRSDSDEMGEFQNGAFKLAIKEKKPILPVRIKGIREAVPKGSWIFKTKVFGSITVLPPIDTENLKTSDFLKLKNAARVELESVAT
ncbi:MAG: 1-acyl-sn-glycerol-3-phosphate acyltransferase [Omnitrophica bacterium]|nr:1-acyl-sn-glycerol-3-phosphate acyltransferase [Candidatus Omnitrophota bacterium]